MHRSLDEIKKLFNEDSLKIKRDSKALKWCLVNHKYDILDLFEKDSWTDENVDLIISLGLEIPSKLFSNSHLLKYLLDNNLFDKIQFFTSESWDDVNIKILQDKILNDYITKEEFPYALSDNVLMLDFLLSNELVDFVYKMNKRAFDEENINLTLDLIEDGILDKIPNGLIENPYFLKLIIEEGYYDLVKDFNRKAWNATNSSNYIMHFEDNVNLSSEMKFSRDFLLSMIFLGKLNQTYLFDDNIWKDDVVDMLFMNIPEVSSNNLYETLIEKYKRQKSDIVKKKIRNYIIINREDLNNIDNIIFIIENLEYSSSSSLASVREEVENIVLSSSNPMKEFKKIEKVFLSDELPEFAKMYTVFRIFHTSDNGKLEYNLYDEYASPVLKKHKAFAEVIIFSDLLKSYLGSNNRCIFDYLNRLKSGSLLLKEYLNGNGIDDTENLNLYVKSLAALYNQTLEGKKQKYKVTGDLDKDIYNLLKLFKVKNESELLDRIVKMYGHYIGINTFDEMINYMKSRVELTDEKNRNCKDFKLKKGDFIKGIGKINHLYDILNNGCLSKDFLGDSALKNGDTTPLDNDGSILDEDVMIDKLFEKNLCAFDYGPIWTVLKNDGKFSVSRNIDEEEDNHYVSDKLELFYRQVLGKDHYAIRTGFSSTDIDYLIVEEYNPKIGFEIARNGFYIPVLNSKGNLVFTSEMYDIIRNQMRGLSYYSEDDYIFSDNLMFDEIEDINLSRQNELISLRISEIVEDTLKPFNLSQKNYLGNDITRGTYEFINIGSSSRGTSDGDADYDFVLLLDGAIIQNENMMNKIRSAIKNSFKTENIEEANEYDFRFKNINIDSSIIDIDISFLKRTDKITYSSDMAVNDRFKNMEKVSKVKTELVKRNIIMAKRILKNAGVYKTHKIDAEYGIGGIGIENWILLHGGSLIDAFNSFIGVYDNLSHLYDGEELLEEFKKNYQIWDFGTDFFDANCESREFISEYMNVDSLKKMATVLKEYLTLDNEFKENKSIVKNQS